MNGIFHGRVSMRGTRFGRGVLFGSFGASTTPVGNKPTDVTLSASSILETALPNTIVATISSNGDAPWLFSIIDDPDGKFRIVGSNLVLDQPLDYETATSHNVTIRAANLGGFHDKELTISVIDVVEAVAPTVVNLSTASVLESAGIGSVVATISSDGTAPVTYTIEADPDGKFRIEGSNLVLDQAIDFETDTEHPVTIRATNAADFALGAFTITVTDVAEAVAPTVVNLSSTSVSESASVGAVVATISSDGTAPVTYTIEADPDGKFRIEGSNLVLDQAIDFETDTEHPVTIRATNAADFALGAFTITVTDVVEAVAPTVVNLSAASVPESAGIGAVVATISSDGTAPVTYTIESDPDGKFAINGNALELAATIDFATDNEHPITIRATNAAGFEVGEFTINVTQAAAALQQDWDPLRDEGTVFDLVVDQATGSDANDGLTIGTAKETINGARAVASRGDVIMVRDTTGNTQYRERLVLTGLGGVDAANKTQIVGYGTEKPTITAAELLTGAVPCAPADEPIVGSNYASIYKVLGFTKTDIASDNPRGLFLFENGRRLSPCMTRLALPQFPLSETNTYDWPDWAEVITTGGVNLPGQILGIRDPEISDQFTQTQIENCDAIQHRDPNGTMRTTIASFDPGTGTITYTDQTRTYESNDNKNRAVLVNCLPAMRRGQWGFVDNGATVDIYFWPYDPAQVDVSIEYSARGNVIDTDGEDNIECRSIQIIRASCGNTGVSADGLYNFTADKTGAVRGTGVNLINVRSAEAYRSITGYGLFWIHNMDNCLVENCRLEDGWGMFGFFFHGGLVTDPIGQAQNAIFRNNLVQRIDKSPMRFYGQNNFQAIYNICEDSGNEAHANKFAAYESASNGIFGWNQFRGCSGRGVWQEASNIYLYMNWLPATYTDIDGRAITDQNNATASPGEFNSTNSDCYMIGNMCPAYRNAKFYANGAVLGTAAWGLTNYCVMNNLFNGLVIQFSRDIANGVKTNVLTSGTAFDPSDTVVAIEDVFEDFLHGDIREKSTSPARTAATTDITTLPGTDGPITLASKFPTLDFARDAAGVSFSLTAPPLGPFVDHDAIPDHGPFYINEPTLNAMPVVGNVTSANDDYYIQAKPFPTGFDIQWVRSTDQYAIAEDWEEISGADSDPYTPVPGDVGYFVARRSAPTGTTIYRYSKVNARVIATHPIAAPTLLADFPDPATKAALEWTETGTFTPTGPTLILFTSLNDNIVESTITATVGTQGRAAGTGTPIAMDAFILRNTRNQTAFALMPDPAAGPVTIQYQSSDGHFSFLVQIMNADGTDSLQFGEASATPTESIEKKLKTTVANTSLLYVLNRYSGDFVADPIAWTGATKIAEENTGDTSTSGDLTSSIAYAQGMPKQTYKARATWADNRNVAAVAIGLVPATVAAVLPVLSAGTGSSTGQTTADWGVTSDTAGGTIFAAIRLATDGQLSKDNIENGTGDAVATDTDATPTADDQNGGSFTGLTAGTSYVIDMFQRDGQPEESAVVSSPAFSTASAVTDIMAGIGDFASDTGWNLEAGVTISGGVLNFATLVSFRGARRLGGDRVPCPGNTTFDLEFTVPNHTSAGRFWMIIEAFDSGGLSLESGKYAYDTAGEENDPAIDGTGTYKKTAAYTSPAGTATIEINFEPVSAATFTVDNLKLTY